MKEVFRRFMLCNPAYQKGGIRRFLGPALFTPDSVPAEAGDGHLSCPAVARGIMRRGRRGGETTALISRPKSSLHRHEFTVALRSCAPGPKHDLRSSRRRFTCPEGARLCGTVPHAPLPDMDAWTGVTRMAFRRCPDVPPPKGRPSKSRKHSILLFAFFRNP